MDMTKSKVGQFFTRGTKNAHYATCAFIPYAGFSRRRSHLILAIFELIAAERGRLLASTIFSKKWVPYSGKISNGANFRIFHMYTLNANFEQSKISRCQ